MTQKITSTVRYMRGTAMTALTLVSVIGSSSVALTAGNITNTPSVSGTYGGGTAIPPVVGTSVDVPIEDAAPVLQLYKTITSVTDNGATGGSADDVINYTFTVTNTGNVTITNISVTDPSATVTGGPIATLAPGASTTLSGSYTVLQADIDAGYFENSATAGGTYTNGSGVTTAVSDVSDAGDDAVETANGAGNTDGDLTNDTTVQTFTQTPGLAVTKTDVLSDPVPNAGDIVSYNNTATNTGNVSLASVTPTDTITTAAGASTLTLIGPSGDADGDSAIDVTEVWQWTATYALTQADVEAGSISNSVSVAAQTPGGTPVTDTSDDPDTATADDPTVTTLPASPALTIAKTFVANNGTPVGVGDVITYTYTVTNTGNVIANAIQISDVHNGTTLTSGGTDTALAPTGEAILTGTLSSDSTVNGSWDTLFPGEEITFTFVYTVTQADVDAQN